MWAKGYGYNLRRKCCRVSFTGCKALNTKIRVILYVFVKRISANIQQLVNSENLLYLINILRLFDLSPGIVILSIGGYRGRIPIEGAHVQKYNC